MIHITGEDNSMYFWMLYPISISNLSQLSSLSVLSQVRLFLGWTETYFLQSSLKSKLRSFSKTRIAVCTVLVHPMYFWMLYRMALSNLFKLSSLSGLSKVRLFYWWTETYYFHQSSIKTKPSQSQELG
jgi:hypothetical protein